MRTLIALFFLGLTSVTAAQADEPVANGNDTSTVNTEAPLLQLASIIAPGETLAFGDLIRFQRLFGAWSLNCDMRPSLNRRICSVEQIVRTPTSDALVWRIAMSAEMKPLVVLSLPPKIDLESGLRMGFSGLEKTVSGAEWLCGQFSCIASFPYADFVQAALSSSKEVTFAYSVKIDGTLTKITARASMDGLAQALNAAAKDPFAKMEPQIKTADITSVAAEKVVAKLAKKATPASPAQKQASFRKLPATSSTAQIENPKPRDGLY